jgi:hypothetical protein
MFAHDLRRQQDSELHAGGVQREVHIHEAQSQLEPRLIRVFGDVAAVALVARAGEEGVGDNLQEVSGFRP